jgi:hypothetical protein
MNPLHTHPPLSSCARRKNAPMGRQNADTAALQFDAGYMHTKQQLHNGPLHVPSSSSPVSWEFAIKIPMRPSPRAVMSEMGDTGSSYLPISATSIADHPLPSSFATEGRHHNTRFEAYVEYHLEATLTQLASGKHHKSDSRSATLPIRLRALPPTTPYPPSDSGLRRRSAQFAASSYRLVPGMEDAELTFKQKSKKFFGSSKVPRFGFTLQYDVPSVIQLGNPLVPIPFRVRVIPDGRRTSEVLQGVPQVVVLSSLQMVLKADTCVVAPGSFGGTHTGEDTVKHTISLPVAFAGNAPASVLKSLNGGDGDERTPSRGKGAANRGPVHRPGSSGGAKRGGVESPGEEQAEESPASSSQGPPNPQPACLPKEEHVAAAGQNPAAAAVLASAAQDEPAGDSSLPPTYQPRENDPPPPASASASEPPPAAAAAAPQADDQPPAYQPVRSADPSSSRGPLVIPSAWDTTGAGGPWIDVGAAVGLRLDETHATALGRKIATTGGGGGASNSMIYPGFTTYCIRHSHRLKWKMSLVVGGETINTEGEGVVSIVGAC